MKPRIVLLLAALLAFALFIGWAQTCASTRAERRERTREHQVYLSTTQALKDSIATLTRAGVPIVREYITRRVLVPAAAETVLVHARDDSAIVRSLGVIMRAGAACDAAYENCAARLGLETRRADLADRAAAAARAGELAEIRRGRAWRPFSLKLPGIVWLAGLPLAGMFLGR